MKTKIRLNFSSAILLALAGAITISKLIHAEWDMAMISGFIAMLVMVKFEVVHQQMLGHGTVIKKIRKIGRLPIFTAVFFVIVVGICLIIINGATQATSFSPRTVANLQSLAIGALVGAIVGLVRWYLGAYSETFYGSPYDATMQYLAQGLTPEEVEEKMKHLKATPLEGTTSVDADGKLHATNVFGQGSEDI